MTTYDRHNPLDGLSASQVILLFERGSRQKLKQPLRDIAINVVNHHQDNVLSPTLESTVKSIHEQTELEEFAAKAAQTFLGDNFDLDKKLI